LNLNIRKRLLHCRDQTGVKRQGDRIGAGGIVRKSWEIVSICSRFMAHDGRRRDRRLIVHLLAVARSLTDASGPTCGLSRRGRTRKMRATGCSTRASSRSHTAVSYSRSCSGTHGSRSSV